MDPKQELSQQEGVKMNPNHKQDKAATSKALGQAFLNHQIRQLETGTSNRGNKHTRRGSGRTFAAPSSRNHYQNHASNNSNTTENQRQQEPPEVASSRIVVDASVLIHALDQIKKWSSNGSSVQLIVPLEALNTLDLLKKGNSTIANRARAASRLLEELVGSNNRVHVQEDAAVVDWNIQKPPAVKDVPETALWVRNTLGCVLWEQKQHTTGVKLAVMDKITITEASTNWDLRSSGVAIREYAEHLLVPLIRIPERSRPEAHQENAWYNGRPPVEAHHPSTRRNKPNRSGSFGGRLVEKPPAPVIPPSGVRLLTRGEMLAP